MVLNRRLASVRYVATKTESSSATPPFGCGTQRLEELRAGGGESPSQPDSTVASQVRPGVSIASATERIAAQGE